LQSRTLRGRQSTIYDFTTYDFGLDLQIANRGSSISMSLILITSDRFAEHRMPPGHPERVERAEVMNAVASRARARGYEVTAPHPASTEQLARVHAPEYIARIAETAGRAIALDPDTYTSAESQGVALLAAGAAIDAVKIAMNVDDSGRGRPSGRPGLNAALAMVRPPGHHAERGRAMGFCLFNNVAVAAAHARADGASRVAIVDYDVHHGNGTQHMFESDPGVLYVSLHQFPFYPGTGAAAEIGRGAGTGFTVNLPLEVGAVDEDYRVAFSEVVVPVLRQYDPDLLLVSAGFDAHERDPLAGMRLTSGAFAAMTMELRRVAEERSEGRLVLVTEGGYDLAALAESLDAVIESLAGPTDVRWPASRVASDRGRVAVSAAKQALAPYWKLG
jgi:acetoin utilization deacetylase AcuC-like enzyme